MGLILDIFRLLKLEFLGPEKQVPFYLKTIQNMLATFLAGFQVSNQYPLGVLFADRIQRIAFLTSTTSTPTNWYILGFVEFRDFCVHL